MATTLGRFGLGSGTATSVTVTAAYRVSENEAFILYTEGGTVFGDVFHVPNPEFLKTLISDYGDGDTLQALLTPGSGDSTVQAIVTEVRTLGS